MISVVEFRNIFYSQLEGELKNFEWDVVLEKPLRTGEAFEWLIAVSILKAAKLHGALISYPLIEPNIGLQEYFFCNNTLPCQNVGKPGNSSDKNTDIWKQYLASMLPKAVISIGENHFSLFKEGLSLSSIFYDSSYEKRADIVIVRGRPIINSCIYDNQKNSLHFCFEDNQHKRLLAIIEPQNTSRHILPLTSREPEEKTILPISLIVECTHNKTLERAEAQLNDYKEHYHLRKNNLLIVSGNELKLQNFDSYQLSLKISAESFRAELEKLANRIVMTLAKDS